MKVRVFSDLHLEFGDYSPRKVDCDLVILAGDIHVKQNAVEWIKRHFAETPVLYVLGNHEYYGEKISHLPDKLRERCAGTPIRILDNEAVEIGGFRFFGATLWTDMRLFGDPVEGSVAALEMNDYKRIRVAPKWKRFRPVDARMLHAASLEKIREFLIQGEPARSIVITHHAPSIQSLPEARRCETVSCAYASDLEKLITEVGPRFWIHGHIHSPQRYSIGNTTVFSNPRGYPDSVSAGFDEVGVIELF